ncbi:MAG TPA: ferrous iron transport protein A [Mycobacteriales bacterium]|nr:ferrous iron transport protein A [Mycobacteriales bacterium]
MESERSSGGERGVRFTRDAGPGDVGVRISLRRVLREGGYGDVLGVVISWDDTSVRIEKRDGSVVEVASADVVAAKRVPPPPPRR